MEQGGDMTDKELLEMAAKAAGYNLGIDWDCSTTGIFINGDDLYSGDKWNPLTNDGDALRLAVMLKMQVSVTTESCRAETLPVLGVRVNDNDEFAATRRAIVMAAANAWADKP